MSSRKSNLILLGAVALVIIAWAFYWFMVGSPVLGVVFLVLGALSLVWLWRAWRQARKT